MLSWAQNYIKSNSDQETAMNSLVGILCGDIMPTGSLPGTISQTQRLGPSRQHWLVETFNEDRDSHALDALIKIVVDEASSSQRIEIAGASSTSLILHHPDIIESHFVVRNSTTHALYGFCATYFFKSTGTAVLGAIFVDPGRRKLSIGRSLHSRAVSSLILREGTRRFQLGSRLPSIYLGIPTDHSLDHKRLRSWFANLGWNTALARPLCSLVARNLTEWSPPEQLTTDINKSTNASFDFVTGLEYAEPILDHIRSRGSQPGLAELYNLALRDTNACGVIRATRPSDGALLGTVVLYGSGSQLAEYVPAVKDIAGSTGGLVGGISSPVISLGLGESHVVLLQGLILLGMRWAKRQGCAACVVDHVSRHGRSQPAVLFANICIARLMVITIVLLLCLPWASMFCTSLKK
jgi:beta-N-acetylhexosaminidase